MSVAVRWLVLSFLILSSLSAVADQIRMYTRGDKSLAAHLVALKGAKRTIDIHTFEFNPCDSSTKLIIGTIGHKRKDEGVRVRVLLDDYMLKDADKKGLAAYFAAIGIEFKVYNASFFLGQNHRSHIKLTVIDGQTYFADSSNFTDSYFGLDSQKNYVNRDFQITGRSAQQAQAAFDMVWDSRPAKAVRGARDGGFFKRCLTSSKRDSQIFNHFNTQAGELAAASAFSCSNITYQADDPDFQSARWGSTDREDRNEDYMNEMRLRKKSATKGFLEFMNGTKRVLNVENQYYIPSHRIRSSFENLREDRGAKVVVLTGRQADGVQNTGEQISHFIMKAARRDTEYDMAVLALPSSGSLRKKHALTPKSSGTWYLHSKSMVRDHKDVWMGSFNIDPRSYHTNLEYGVVVKNCTSLANAIERDYQRMIDGYSADLKNCSACRNEFPDLNPLETLDAILKFNFL
jgi:cardiolipin synthase C